MSLKDVGIEDYDFKTGELWSFSGYKKREKGAPVAFLQGFDAVELDTTLNLGTKLIHYLLFYIHILVLYVFTCMQIPVLFGLEVPFRFLT